MGMYAYPLILERKGHREKGKITKQDDGNIDQLITHDTHPIQLLSLYDPTLPSFSPPCFLTLQGGSQIMELSTFRSSIALIYHRPPPSPSPPLILLSLVTLSSTSDRPALPTPVFSSCLFAFQCCSVLYIDTAVSCRSSSTHPSQTQNCTCFPLFSNYLHGMLEAKLMALLDGQSAKIMPP